MSIRSVVFGGAVSLGLALAMTVSMSGVASAACVSKSAQATSGSESSAKWFAMETMVQAVSWGLWPGWVATGEVSGYTVKKERYKCSADGGSHTCISWATFCEK